VNVSALNSVYTHNSTGFHTSKLVNNAGEVNTLQGGPKIGTSFVRLNFTKY